MKLHKNQILVVSFMLFSLFFGAGNLIFPPFLGQNAGSHTPGALLGFFITAVILPVLGVVVVAKFNGLDSLAQNVNKQFSIVFTILIYLSIGPGLGIPRAASVPFEMAIAPYLPDGASFSGFMFLYSLIFFLIAGWLCLTPQKLLNRVGHFLTPSLLTLILLLFFTFLFHGKVNIAPPQEQYQSLSFLQGFNDGYQTMDTIAALNFGLVIATALNTLGLQDKKSVMNYTVLCGIFAGTILSLVYFMLTYLGMASSGVYTIADNGAVALRQITHQLFGTPGAIILAAIFTLACLTTCVGLINSISLFFSKLYPKLKYHTLVIVITGFSFLVCNQGLNTILSISIPVLNAIYPVSIVLILLGLTHDLHHGNAHIYPSTIYGTVFISIFYALDQLHVPLGFIKTGLNLLPLYGAGFGWVSVAAVMAVCSLVAAKLHHSSANAIAIE